MQWYAGRYMVWGLKTGNKIIKCYFLPNLILKATVPSFKVKHAATINLVMSHGQAVREQAGVL